MIYTHPLTPHDYTTIQVGDTLQLPNGSLAICTATEEPTTIPSYLGDIQQGRSFSMRVIGNADRNPSPVETARIKEALALSPASEPSGQAHPPTSDNTIYVNQAESDDPPVPTPTYGASA